MTTLIDYVDTLVDKLRAALPEVPTITADRPDRQQRSLRVPAIHIELDSFDSMQEAGDSRLVVDVQFQARCLVDPNSPRAELLTRALAAQLAVALHEIRKPVPGHGHIRLQAAGDDAFRPEMDGYAVWLVEFAIEIALGDLEPPRSPPSEIYVSWSPRIGAKHVDDYESLS